MCRLLHEFEKEYNSNEGKLAKHNEDNKTFQNDFYNDVLKVFKGFPNNPFQLQDLTVVNNTDIIFDENIYYNLSKLESTGSDQIHNFIQTRLILSKISVKVKITLNHFILPGDENSKKPRGSLNDKRLSIFDKIKGRHHVPWRPCKNAHQNRNFQYSPEPINR